jgi:plastocyanin
VVSLASSRSGGIIAAFLLAALAACGGNGGGGSPTSPPPVSGSPGPAGATITIGANGAVSPSQVTVSVGQSVTFVNSHNQAHAISSDPHPVHTDCPQINALGTLGAGQTRSTNAFSAARTCGFHDHNDPDNPSLAGRIIIQ